MTSAITIGNDDTVTATILPQGAIVETLVDQSGANVLYPFHVRENGSERGGSFVAFPAFGPPAPVYDGENQHGWLRDDSATVDFANNTATVMNFRKVGGLYRSNVGFHVTHTVCNKLFKTELQFVCSSDRENNESPLFRPGFHPYFPNDGETRVDIGGKEYNHFSATAKCVMIGTDTPVTVYTGKCTIRMKLHGFTGSTCVYLWSDNPEKYFCVEPVYCTQEDFLTGKYLRVAPDTLYEFMMQLDII